MNSIFTNFTKSVMVLWFVALLSTSLLAQPALSAPSDGATAQSVNPVFSWGLVSGATNYNLHVSTDPGFSTLVINEYTASLSYSHLTPDLDNYTQYYWKVRSYDGSIWSSFSAAFSFRTELAAPVLSTPSDASIFASLTPTLTWNTVTGATAYDLQVATDVIFTNIVESAAGETGTSYALTTTLNNYTVYYWRVRATDGSETAGYSAPFTFRTLVTTPVLSSPADEAVVQPVNTVFDWDDVTGATSYRLQVATDAGFTNIVSNITGIGSSGHTLSAALDYYTAYYWRVSAFDGANETVFSSVWSFETEIDAPDLVSPGYLSPGNSIHPTLVWRTVDGADNYRAQFSALSDFSVLMYDSVMTDTTLYIDSILANNTLYYWRVYAENANPDVSPWSSSVFRTVTEVIPYLTHPINNHLVYTLSPTLHWNINVSGVGISYDVQYSVDSTFPAALTTTLDAGAAITDTLSGLLPATQYFWRVRSKNTTAIITYSAQNSFTTFGEVNTIPTQSWPVGGATVYTLSPDLYWYLGTTSFGYTYEIRYKEVSSGTWSSTISAGTALTYTLTGLTAGTDYEWQVRSLNGVDESDWSASAYFTTYSPASVTPVVPNVSYPTDGVMVYTLMPTLHWWIGQSHAGLTFEIEIDATTQGNTVYSITGITDISYQHPVALLPGTTYYFRVRSNNGTTTSGWSADESFVTFGVTGEIEPILTFPIGGQVIYSSSTTLNWYVVGSANTISYELQFKAGDANFTSTIVQSGTSYEATSLQAGTTYYWRVRSYNGNDYSDWTATETFEVTGNAGTLVPILTWPLGGAATGTTVDLYWYVNGSSPSISYQVMYASESDFSNAVTVNAGSSTTTQLTGLVAGVIYYWKVRSHNGTVYSNWSDTETFATQPGSSPVRPMGGSPVNSVGLSTNNAQLSWFLPTLTNGLIYEVQYSQNSDFSNAVTVENITTTSYMANALPTGAPIYWRVRSKNAQGLYSAYSEAERFTPNTPTGVEETVIPTEFALGQNYPNPFNPATVINFDLPQEVYVTIKIYDMLGREVKTLIADTKAAGSYSVQWAGDNNSGSTVSAGTYLYRIAAGNFVQARKMVYLK